jgi:hypothetical protein
MFDVRCSMFDVRFGDETELVETLRDVQKFTLRAIGITPFASQFCPDRFGVCAFMADSRLRISKGWSYLIYN